MKRIEVAYPFEAARGALGGKQKLVYNDHDNPAFDAPLGRQYAKNYRPQMIAAKRASDGLNYFQVKTKSAVNNTVQGLVKQAAFAVANYMYAQILKDKSVGGLLDRLQRALPDDIAAGNVPAGTSLRKYFVSHAYEQLVNHIDDFGFGVARSGYSSVIIFANPYAELPTSGAENWVKIEIPQSMLVKFWMQLAVNRAGDTPIKFMVENMIGIAFAGVTFDTLISGNIKQFNILDLKQGEVITGDDVVYIGEIGAPRYLQLSSNYVLLNDTVTTDAKYTTTTTEPA